MTGHEAVSEFLRHAGARDVPIPELFRLKAWAFDLLADETTDPVLKAECREVARRAREYMQEEAG